jgi:type VI secretion system protein
MTLTLSITNFDQLDIGQSTSIVLDRHGAIIGRSLHADWSLPDPRNYISSTHCEVEYRGGAYWLIDRSRNGVRLNGAEDRMAQEHRLADGDVLFIGHYRIEARLGAEPAPAVASPDDDDAGWRGWRPPEPEPAPKPHGLGFTPPPAAPRPAAPEPSDWQRAAADPGGWAPEPAGAWGRREDDDRWAEPASALSGRGPMAGSFTPPPVDQPRGPHDVWAELEQVNQVDWGRAGFDTRWGVPAEPTTPPLAPEPAPAPRAPKVSPAEIAWNAFIDASGLEAEELGPPARAGATAGALVRRLISGLVVMLEARAKAKSQLGARATIINPDNNNPLKFCLTPDQALTMLLGPPPKGYMPADRAVDDAFKDLQAHQVATLMAMQGALAATLARFSPEAIRERTTARGGLGRILPGARDAELWRAYEREFEGVAKGSDEAFMDVFAKEFRAAYERAAGR